MKKVILICSALVIYLGQSACRSTESVNHLNQITFSQANQQFSIVSFYSTMPAYIKEAHENRAQIDRIYKKYVFDPIWDDFASMGECSFLIKNIKNPITDFDRLNTEIEFLSESGVEEIIKSALLEISNVLPGPHTTVYIQVLDPSYKKAIPSHAQKIFDMGIHADTYGTGRIFIAIDATAINWKTMLPRVVAHEYHHSVWISRSFESIHFRLLDCLILEGRAEAFADLVYPDTEAPWPNFADASIESYVWKRMKQDLFSRDEQLILKMFTGNKEIPFLSVYSIGYNIMQEFIKRNPGVLLMEWTDMDAEEILLKSGYEKKFRL